ncbi:hypothetical protein C9374_007204 [Naegleria lovaniensis]|uniref:Uncharacterized protein n=1 Tax=Naegleria lovaniensis TaxID=51637 RepID=A0AA88H349_NAELO|nr:uncharacterized protein C9374_007204 [Naegleria lovaniensis]KAG2393673.1 hypothetical protein C9374_007204 [Naegleria lovaniensis]
MHPNKHETNNVVALYSSSKPPPNKIHQQQQESNKLIPILKSFGIQIEMDLKLSFGNSESSGLNLQQEFLQRTEHESYKYKKGTMESIRSNNICRIYFQCRDHLKAYHVDMNDQDFYSNNRYDRVNESVNTIQICIHGFFKSMRDLLACPWYANKSKLEEEIINGSVEILDIDYSRKHVLIRLKNELTEKHDSPEHDENGKQQEAILMLGKIDHSNHAFLFNVTQMSERINDGKLSHFRKIENIYELSVPKILKNRCCRVGKDGKKEMKDVVTDVGIRRVLIGCFFSSMTTTAIHRYCYTRGKKDFRGRNYNIPSFICSPKERYCGVFISASGVNGERYSGVIDCGYYKFELKSWSFALPNNNVLESFTSYFIHDIIC